jgi:hypothetical protein
MPSKEKLPNQIITLALTTFDEIIGVNGTKSLLNYTGLQKFIGNYPPYNLDAEQDLQDFTGLTTGLFEIMGVKGARPIMFRSGMRGFEVMREKFPSLWNMEHVQPSERTPERLFDEFVRIQRIVIAGSAQIFGDIFKIYENDEGFVLENHDCYWCKGMKADEPVCYGSCGFNYSVGKWVMGKEIKVDEPLCHAKGDPFCKFVMHRPPA